MELEDASFEETPTTNTRKKDLTKSEWLEVISMLVMMTAEDHLQRHAIMKLAKRFNISLDMVYRLWECKVCMHATGIINSPDLTSWKKF